jgi:cell division septation protein DedD
MPFLAAVASVIAALWVGYLAGGVLLSTGTARPQANAKVSIINAGPSPKAKSESTLEKASPAETPQSPLPVKQLPPAQAKALLHVDPAPAKQPVAVPPVSAPGTVLVQVAAVTRSEVALALAETLIKKGFASFVVNPQVDKFYRVQVGPFRDMQSARAAKEALAAQGFPSFFRKQ